MSIIATQGLTKHFGKTRALAGVDLEVNEGEVYGFIGPNGAGKSTTIRVLLGILRATGGTAQLFGRDAWRDAVDLHKRLAYVPGDVNLWPNLTGGEVIDLFVRMRRGANRRYRDELIQKFNLDPTKKAGTYSKGNRQKVALVAALSSDVDLYILDEPTSGLDPLMEIAFRDCIKEVVDKGRTVFLSSHILSEVEQLCDKLSIIRQGVIVDTGTLEDLRHLTHNKVTVRTAQPLEGLAAQPGVYDLVQKDGKAEFSMDNNYTASLMSYLAAHGVQQIVSVPPTLEELFIRHYGIEQDGAQDGAPKPAAVGDR
jgi:ABC-2 type transport system ATP-binding protein